MGVCVDFSRTSDLLVRIPFLFVCRAFLLDDCLRHETAIVSDTQAETCSFCQLSFLLRIELGFRHTCTSNLHIPLALCVPAHFEYSSQSGVPPILLPAELSPPPYRHGVSIDRAALWELQARMPQTRYRQIPQKIVKKR